MPDILHISDLHFGPRWLADRAAAVHELAERLRPDVVAVTGDLTQRAKRAQYAEAREFLERFAAPLVVIPGNHDVPLYRVAERFFASHRNYREYIRGELNSVLRLDGCTIVALDSTRRFTFTNGRIRRWQIDFTRKAFADSPSTDLRVVATHHHLAPPPDLEGAELMPGARHALEAFVRCGVDLVLAGHVHRSYISRSSDAAPGLERVIPIIHCGTTTSSRGRGRERLRNSLNYVRARDDGIVVTHYLWRDGGDGFRPYSEHRFGSRLSACLDQAER
ncbi:MAG: metallophosphoesterase family protein [Gemmatimonadota bacterium]